MYTIRGHRKEVALGVVVTLAMILFFAACILGPWAALTWSPWLAIVLALVAAGAWARFGLMATGGPVATLSRTVLYIVSGLVIVVAIARIIDLF